MISDNATYDAVPADDTPGGRARTGRLLDVIDRARAAWRRARA